MIKEVEKNGRILIPKEVRKEIKLEEGDKMRITVEGKKVVLTKEREKESKEERIKKIVNEFEGVMEREMYERGEIYLNTVKKLLEDVKIVLESK